MTDKYARGGELLQELIDANAAYRTHKSTTGLAEFRGIERFYIGNAKKMQSPDYQQLLSLHQAIWTKGDELLSYVMEAFPLTDVKEATKAYQEHWANLTEDLLANEFGGEISLEESLRRVPDQIIPVVVVKVCVAYYCIAFDTRKMKMFDVFGVKYKRVIVV